MENPRSRVGSRAHPHYSALEVLETGGLTTQGGSMNPRRLLQALAVAVIVSAAATVGGAPGAPTATPSPGFYAVTGTAAASFTLPTDVELVQRLELGAYGLTYERYQQRYGPTRANVVGGQLTLYRDAAGSVRLVLGAHYPAITATNRVSVSAAQARERVAAELRDH